MAWNSVAAEINIDDGVTLTIGSSTTAADDYDTDHQATAGGGTIHVTSSGELRFSSARTISNGYGEGRLILDGELLQDAAASSAVHAVITASGGSVIRSESSNLHLLGGGSYAGGTSFQAAGGDIYFAGGDHVINGAVSLSGSGSLHAWGGKLDVLGTINASTGAAAGKFVMDGGTVGGFSSLGGGVSTVSVDTLDLRSGVVGDVRLRLTGDGSKTTASPLLMNRGTIVNQGSFTHAAGEIDASASVSGSGYIFNEGVWEMHDDTVVGNSFNTGGFRNEGTLLLATGAHASIQTPLTQTASGMISIPEGGWLRLSGGGSLATASAVAVDGQIEFRSGIFELGWLTLTGDGKVTVSSSGIPGIVQLNGSIGPVSGPATGTLSFKGGGVTVDPLALALGGELVGSANFESGDFQSGIFSRGRLRLTGASEQPASGVIGMPASRLINEGTMIQRGLGYFDLDPDDSEGVEGIIENKGTWTMDGSPKIRSTHGEGMFKNDGILEKTGLLGISSVAAEFSNGMGATVRVAPSSFLSFENGSLWGLGSIIEANGSVILGEGIHLVADSQLTGAGYLYISGIESGSIVLMHNFGAATGPATGGLSISGGHLSGNPLIGGPATANFDHGSLGDGRISVLSTRFTGAVVKPANSTLTLDGGVLRNEGTMTQHENGDFELDSEAPDAGNILNTGTWNVAGVSKVRNTDGAGAFRNEGMLEVLENAGMLQMSGNFTNAAGATLRTQSGGEFSSVLFSTFAEGSLIDAAGGDVILAGGFHLLKGPSITGSGALRASVGDVHVTQRIGTETGAATGGFTLNGATVKGAWSTGIGLEVSGPGVGNLAVSHGELKGGTIDGVHLRYTGNVSRGGLGNIVVRDGSITVDGGTLNQSAGSDFQLDSSATAGVFGTLANRGNWNVLGSVDFDSAHGEGVFLNSGPLSVSAGTATFRVGFQNGNGGTVAASGGDVALQADSNHVAGSVLSATGGYSVSLQGGTHHFSGGGLSGSGYVYARSGTMVMSGNVGATNGSASGKFGMTGGTITGTGMLSAGTGYYSSGTLNGDVTLRFTDEFIKAQDSLLGMTRGTIRNDGSHTASTGGHFDLDNSDTTGGGTVINKGSWTTGAAVVYSNSHGQGVFRNEGLFRVTGGSMIMVAPFQQSGSAKLRVTGGNAYLNGGGSVTNGSYEADGGDIYFNGGTYTMSGGALAGSSHVFANAGTVTIAGNVGNSSGAAQGGFGISGGTVNGTGTLSAERGWFSWGTVSGSPTLRFTGTSTKDANTHLGVTGGTIRNEGTWNNLASGNIDLDSDSSSGGGTLINTGTWNFLNTAVYSNSYGGGLVLNHGLMHSSAGGSRIYAAMHHKSGSTFRSSAGSIYFHGGGLMESGATLHANGGDLYFTGGTQQFQGGSITGPNHVYLSAGVIDVSGSVNATTGRATGGIGLAGATVTGSGMISADHGYFSGGQINGGVTLRLTGNSSKIPHENIGMNGGTLINEGTWANAAHGNFDLDNGPESGAGKLVNKGAWNLNEAAIYNNTYGGGVVDNFGLMHSLTGVSRIYGAMNHKAGSTFRVSSSWLLFHGGGVMEPGATLDANGGDLYFHDGTHQFQGGSITGASHVYVSGGTVNVTGDVNATSGPATGGFGISGGTVTGSGMLSPDHGYFANGQINGEVKMRLTGATTKAAHTTIGMNGGTIVNEGTWENTSYGNIDLDNGPEDGVGKIVNKGTWKFNDTAIYNNTYTGGVMDNHGLMLSVAGNSRIYGAMNHKSGSTARISSGWLMLHGGGVLESGATLDANGGDLYFNGGTHQFQGGAITGASHLYVSSGTVNVTGNVNAATGPATGGLGITGGTVTGTQTLSVDHGAFYSGQVNGGVTLRLTGNSSKSAHETLGMNGGTLINEGTWSNAAYGNIDLDNGPGEGAGKLVNNGTWNFTDTAVYNNTYTGGVVDNFGLMHSLAGGSRIYGAMNHKAGSTFRSSSGWLMFHGGGVMDSGATLDVNGGDLYFQGGTHELKGGSITGSSHVYASGGTVNVTGDVNAVSGPATGGFGISGATVTGTHTLSADHGSFWNGQVNGGVTIRLTGSGTKFANDTLNLSGGALVNEGTFTQQSYGNFNVDNSPDEGGGTILNRGTWNMPSSCVFENSYGGGNLANEGLMEQADGTVQMHALLQNSGTMRQLAGSLYFYRNTTHSGNLIANGYVAFGSGGAHVMSGASSVLSGTGGTAGTLSLSDGATISPGNPVGSLTNHGTLQFAVGGVAPAVAVDLGLAGHDSIVLASGSLLALGTDLTELRISLGNAPAPGAIYRIVNGTGGSGSFTGRFKNAAVNDAVISASHGGQAHYFLVNYDPAGKFIDLKSISGFTAWILGKGLSGDDAAMDADPDGDGIPNGIEFVLNGEPNPARANWDSRGLLPVMTLDEMYFRFTYRRHVEAAYLEPLCQHGGSLVDWTAAVHEVDGIVVTVDDGFYDLVTDRVEVAIPRSLAEGGKLFGRLHATE